jgi:molybdopterin-binding protein
MVCQYDQAVSLTPSGSALQREEEPVNLSARNMLKGRVTQVTPGTISAEVIIELPGGGEIIAIISTASAERLRLSPGREAYAVIRANDVMVATE